MAEARCTSTARSFAQWIALGVHSAANVGMAERAPEALMVLDIPDPARSESVDCQAVGNRAKPLRSFTPTAPQSDQVTEQGHV